MAKAFFAVRGADGETYYTRNGDFKLSVNADNSLNLVTSEGYLVLDSNGNAITIPAGVNTSRLVISTDGQFGYQDAEGNYISLNQQLGVYQFNNAAGLEKLSGSLLQVTAASGAPIK